MFPNLVTDVGKIRYQHAVWSPPDYEVITDPLEAASLLRSMRNRAGPLVVDIECDIEKDSGYDHPNQYDMLCIGLAETRDRVFVLAKDALVEDVYMELGLLLRVRQVVCQNGKFDLAGLYPHTGAAELSFDTMLASYCFDERPGVHSLEFQGVEYLGAPNWKHQIEKYNPKKNGYGAIPPDVLHKYNAYDLAVTFDLFLMYEARFRQRGNEELRRVHDFLVRASNQLMFVELNGIALDRQYLDQLTHEYLDRIADIVQELRQILESQNVEVVNGKDQVIEFNPASPIQVKQVLRKLGVKVPDTNEKTINKVIDALHIRAAKEDKEETEYPLYEFCRTLLKHRREAKLYGTYVKGARKRLYRGRLYPTFLLHGTTSGRLSCRNPNLQNVPRESSIRRLYVPSRPGNVFVQVDYSQAELRVLSFLAGDKYFRDIFNSGDRDLFDELTPILYPELPSKDQVPAAQWKETRIRVKAYVYGLAYGRTEFSIADEYGIPVREARRGMNAFFDVIPEIVAFREKTKQEVLSGRPLVTPFGRHRRYTLITDENKMDIIREALSFKPQSISSDLCLDAFAEIRPKLKGLGWVRNIIHDAMLAECAEDKVDVVTQLMQEEMLASAKRLVGDYVAFATEATVGKSWGDV